MEWIIKHNFLGSEYDFVASDIDGHIAYFSSAGFGPIPVPIARLGDTMYEICEKVDLLKKTGKSEIISQKENLFEWVETAERGFYSYDWAHERQNYELVTIPLVPIHFSHVMNKELRSVFDDCRFANICFSKTFTFPASQKLPG